jgi:hypothetical protein
MEESKKQTTAAAPVIPPLSLPAPSSEHQAVVTTSLPEAEEAPPVKENVSQAAAGVEAAQPQPQPQPHGEEQSSFFAHYFLTFGWEMGRPLLTYDESSFRTPMRGGTSNGSSSGTSSLYCPFYLFILMQFSYFLYF